MDILWAMSHSGSGFPAAAAQPNGMASSSAFAVPTPPYSDGSWDMYQDFVGGLQFWGYALVSGSGDSAVRMWDSAHEPPTSIWSREADVKTLQCVQVRPTGP